MRPVALTSFGFIVGLCRFRRLGLGVVVAAIIWEILALTGALGFVQAKAAAIAATG
jgi:hypothetical protein